MKNNKTKLLILIPALLVAGIYYYAALPAINIHSAGLWWFLIFALAVIFVVHIIRRAAGKAGKKIVGYNPVEISLKDDKAGKFILILIHCHLFRGRYFVLPLYQCPEISAADDSGKPGVYRGHCPGGLQYHPPVGQIFCRNFRRPENGKHGRYGFPICSDGRVQPD